MQQNQNQKILNLIGSANIEAALDQLMSQLSGQNNANEVVLLKSRYSDLKRQVRNGLISNQEETLRRNQIVNSIIALVDELKEMDAIPDSRSQHQSENDNDANGKNRKQLALLIGCNRYEHANNLVNPINDAIGMEQKLQNLGFDVSLLQDPNLVSLNSSITKFGKQLESYDVGLFFFAGHGVQVDGENFLLPVNTDIHNSKKEDNYNCARVDSILDFMEVSKSNTNIIILDACRDNPLTRSLKPGFGSRGLASVNAPAGSLIAYATAPGKTANDNRNENNGLYTGELIKHINNKGITIEEMFRKVRRAVMDSSDDRQIPWESTSLTGGYYFNP